MTDRNDSATVDTGEAIKFLKLIDPSAQAFTFQTFREKGDDRDIVPRVTHDPDLSEVAHKHDAGSGIYTVVNETDGKGRKTENIVRVRAVWQEDDDGYAGAFPLPPSIIVESSPAHFHRYWLIADDWPADVRGRADFAAVMERMVATYGSDKGAKDISRVLRLPGFLHRKADKGPVSPFLVRIVEASGQRYTREQILTAFPPVARQQSKPHTKWKPRDNNDERIRAALGHISADDRDTWGGAIMPLMPDCDSSACAGRTTIGRRCWRQSQKHQTDLMTARWTSGSRC